MAVNEIITATFETKIKTNRFVLIDVYADWCGPCKMLAPQILKASEHFNQVKFFKLNVDRERNIAMQLGIMSIPTVLFYKDGVLVDQFVGFKQYIDLVEFINRNIH